jgi:hypothetical protein
MGKSYRRHHKRPKRKSTRSRRGGTDASSSTTSSLSSMIPSSSSMKTTLQKHYENGEKAAQPHVDKINKMATDLHKQAYDSGKKSYKGFKYSSPTNFAIAKSGESAYSTASKSMQPHYDKMKSSMGSMGSSMGFSSLSTKTPNVKELQHAQEASSMGVPTAFSQTSQTSAL